MTGFADFFSGRAKDYAEFRPTYPRALGEWLARQAPARDLAWDCGTGSGQAAGVLAEWFSRVHATDPSESQLRSAQPHPKIEYHVGREASSGLEPGSVSLVTAAQAVHWFDLPAFWTEARRVLRPNGLVAVWGYGLPRIESRVDAAIDRFYTGAVGAFWPPQRRLVETEYRELDFPFRRLAAPDFQIQARWDRDDLLGYVSTWSAVTRCRRETGVDPVQALAASLESAWPDGSVPRRVVWPLFMMAGRPG
jgi:SAM-dependent methyltransferase